MTKRYVVQSYQFIETRIIGEFDTMSEAQECMRSNIYAGGVGLLTNGSVAERPVSGAESDRIFDITRSVSGG